MATRWRAATGAVRALISLGVLTLLACLPIVWTTLGQRADERSRWSVAVPGRTSAALTGWLRLVSVEAIAVVLVIAVLVALARRRVSNAVAAAIVVAGANVTTQLIKFGVPRPDRGIGPHVGNTLPSGHVTVVGSLVLAAVLVTPVSWRRVMVFLAAGAGTLTGAAVLIARWHRPSDVIAAYAVCGLLTGLALLLTSRQATGREEAGGGDLRAGERPVRARSGRGPGSLVLAAFAGAALVGVVLVGAGLAAHPDEPNALLGATVLTCIGIACAVLLSLVGIALDRIGAGDRVVGGRG